MPAQQKQFSRLAQALIFAAAIVFVPTASADDSERVTIAYGTVQGTTRASGVRAFLGIPYAAPPVGKLRWMPPQPVKVWDGVRVCTSSGPWCPQPAPLFGNETGPQDEDCLYLNVWSPEPQENVRFPVMVWIHGGGWTTGSGAQSMYDGERLAQEGIVVVTINYRLGPFGFFAHPLLSAESGNGTSGNYGMMDQIEALRWVKQNIAAFNGDKDCVTIFGESAGGGSVARLLVSPPAAGLFHRAIIQSSGLEGYNAHLRYHWYDSEPMEVVGERIAAQLVPKTTDMLGVCNSGGAQGKDLHGCLSHHRTADGRRRGFGRKCRRGRHQLGDKGEKLCPFSFPDTQTGDHRPGVVHHASPGSHCGRRCRYILASPRALPFEQRGIRNSGQNHRGPHADLAGESGQNSLGSPGCGSPWATGPVLGVRLVRASGPRAHRDYPHPYDRA
jgi:hypothetical protein